MSGIHRASDRPAAPSGTKWHPTSLSTPSTRKNRAVLQRLVQKHAGRFKSRTKASNCAELSRFIKDKLNAVLQRGILAHRLPRMRCGKCGTYRLLAFDCRRREFCPSWGSQRMSQTTAYLVDHANPRVQVSMRIPPLPAAGPGNQQAGRGVAAEHQPGATKELVADCLYRSASGTRHPGLKPTAAVKQPLAACACGSPPEPQAPDQRAQRSPVPARRRRPIRGCRLRQGHPRYS